MYKQRYTMNNWIQRKKKRGVKFHLDPKDLYKIWNEKKNCDFCNKIFEEDEKKCLEHHHASGTIRGICCHKCNMKLGTIDKNLKNVLLELHRFWFRL